MGFWWSPSDLRLYWKTSLWLLYLFTRRDVASVDLFYCYYFGRCSSMFSETVPMLKRAEATRWRTILLSLEVDVLKIDQTDSSFSQLIQLWYQLSFSCISVQYNLDSLKRLVNTPENEDGWFTLASVSCPCNMCDTNCPSMNLKNRLHGRVVAPKLRPPAVEFPRGHPAHTCRDLARISWLKNNNPNTPTGRLVRKTCVVLPPSESNQRLSFFLATNKPFFNKQLGLVLKTAIFSIDHQVLSMISAAALSDDWLMRSLLNLELCQQLNDDN